MLKNKKLIISLASLSAVAMPLSALACSSQPQNNVQTTVDNFLSGLKIETPAAGTGNGNKDDLNDFALMTMLDYLPIVNSNEVSTGYLLESFFKNFNITTKEFNAVPENVLLKAKLVRGAQAAASAKQTYTLHLVAEHKSGDKVNYSNTRTFALESTDTVDDATTWNTSVNEGYVAVVTDALKLAIPSGTRSTLLFDALPTSTTEDKVLSQDVLRSIFGNSLEMDLTKYPTNLHGCSVKYSWSKATSDTTTSSLTIKVAKGEGAVAATDTITRTVSHYKP